jgi:hypothetical protein
MVETSMVKPKQFFKKLNWQLFQREVLVTGTVALVTLI